MGLQIKVETTGDVAQKLKNAGFKMAYEVDKALLTAAILVEGVVKKKISRGGATGKMYKVGKKKVFRSAAGEPPHTDTGRLVGSIHHTHSFLEATVDADVFYAVFLELGTKKMAARPFMQPSLDESEDQIEQLIIDAVERTMG